MHWRCCSLWWCCNRNDLGNALLKLYQDNASTLTPDPVFVQFYYSHPPALERLGRMQHNTVSN